MTWTAQPYGHLTVLTDSLDWQKAQPYGHLTVLTDEKSHCHHIEKDDAYMVDCTVTGSDAGTSDAPKFSLKSLFEEHIFPEIAVPNNLDLALLPAMLERHSALLKSYSNRMAPADELTSVRVGLA